MAVEPAQINLAALLAGWANEPQAGMASGDCGAEPQMEPELATLCAPAVPMATMRLASRSATSETASRARFSSLSSGRSLVPVWESCAPVRIGQVVSASVVLCSPLPTRPMLNPNAVGTKILRGDSFKSGEISGKYSITLVRTQKREEIMRKLILATLATVALGSAALAQSPYPPRPDFPGAKQFDPASPAYLGVGNNRNAAMGLSAGGAQPSKEELAKHKAYVESLRRQAARQYRNSQ
jgi:hypothetical protein